MTYGSEALQSQDDTILEYSNEKNQMACAGQGFAGLDQIMN